MIIVQTCMKEVCLELSINGCFFFLIISIDSQMAESKAKKHADGVDIYIHLQEHFVFESMGE